MGTPSNGFVSSDGTLDMSGVVAQDQARRAASAAGIAIMARVDAASSDTDAATPWWEQPDQADQANSFGSYQLIGFDDNGNQTVVDTSTPFNSAPPTGAAFTPAPAIAQLPAAAFVPTADPVIATPLTAAAFTPSLAPPTAPAVAFVPDPVIAPAPAPVIVAAAPAATESTPMATATNGFVSSDGTLDMSGVVAQDQARRAASAAGIPYADLLGQGLIGADLTNAIMARVTAVSSGAQGTLNGQPVSTAVYQSPTAVDPSTTWPDTNVGQFDPTLVEQENELVADLQNTIHTGDISAYHAALDAVNRVRAQMSEPPYMTGLSDDDVARNSPAYRGLPDMPNANAGAAAAALAQVNAGIAVGTVNTPTSSETSTATPMPNVILSPTLRVDANGGVQPVSPITQMVPTSVGPTVQPTAPPRILPTPTRPGTVTTVPAASSSGRGQIQNADQTIQGVGQLQVPGVGSNVPQALTTAPADQRTAASLIQAAGGGPSVKLNSFQWNYFWAQTVGINPPDPQSYGADYVSLYTFAQWSNLVLAAGYDLTTGKGTSSSQPAAAAVAASSGSTAASSTSVPVRLQTAAAIAAIVAAAWVVLRK